MKTKLIALLLLTAGVLHADDPFAAIRSALVKNQLEAADAALAPLAAEENPDARVWFYLSQVRARQRQTKEAIALAEKAVAARPDEAEFHSHLGMTLAQRAGEVNFMHQALLAGRMLNAFTKSVELDPNHIAGYIGLSRYYMHAPSIAGGGREPAERYAREVEKRHAALGTIELAMIAERFDDPARAYELFTRAAEMQPEAAWIEEALGRVSEKLGRAEAARTHYEKAVALDPNRPSAKEAVARLSTAKS